MYKVNELANLAGISPRTLRHYDDIGLLVPSRNQSSYRLYTEKDLDTLQTILFYKELGYELKEIKNLLDSKNYMIISSLESLKEQLKDKVKHYQFVLSNIEKTIKYKKGVYNMKNEEKFQAFKEKQIKDNMDQYGQELKEKYDPDFIEKSNDLYRSKSKYQMKQQEDFTIELNKLMKEAMLENDPKSPLAMKMCEMHKKWLMFYWPSYSKEAHLSIVEMYNSDERFTQYYDKIHPGLARFLLESMRYYVK